MTYKRGNPKDLQGYERNRLLVVREMQIKAVMRDPLTF